jgi:hypothetical protein
MTDFETEQQIRVMAAARISTFEDWTHLKPTGDNFAEVPWLEIVSAASLALMTVDKHLKAAADVIARLSKLYDLLVKKRQADATTPPITLAEKIIVALADERARHGEGVTLGELEAVAKTPTDHVKPELERLRSLSVVIEANGRWSLRTASD